MMHRRRAFATVVVGWLGARALSAVAQSTTSSDPARRAGGAGDKAKPADAAKPATPPTTAKPANPARPAVPGKPGGTNRPLYGSGSIRVALLLPAPAGTYGKAQAALLAGIRAAHQRDGQGVQLELLEISDDGAELAAVYKELDGRGFALAIGPLTRSAVHAVIDTGGPPVPTLALNQPDADRVLPSNVVVFGLAIESEGRQAAIAAFDDAAERIPQRRPLRAVCLVQGSPLARRSAAAFADAWAGMGGQMLAPIESDARTSEQVAAAASGARADVVFLAVPAEVVRNLRAALPQGTGLYATSLLNSGAMPEKAAGSIGAIRTPELDGLRIVEMPWQVAPEHLAVVTYPKAPMLRNLELQRLYALGIDAWRVAAELLQQRQHFEIDGVTGRLRFDLAHDARIDRTSMLAEYRNGVLVPLGSR